MDEDKAVYKNAVFGHVKHQTSTRENNNNRLQDTLTLDIKLLVNCGGHIQ